MKQLVIKVILFTGLVTAVLYLCDDFFVDGQHRSYQSFQSIYQHEKNSIDVVFLGNSHLYMGVDNFIIESKCDINTISVAAGRLNIAEVYFNLQEVLKYHTPKLVVIETWPLISEGDAYNKIFTRFKQLHSSNFYNPSYKRFGWVQTKELILSNREHRLYKFFNMAKNHDWWKDPERWSRQLRSNEELVASEFIQAHAKNDKVFSEEQLQEFKAIAPKFSYSEMYLSEMEKEYLASILKLSKQHKFEILFITVPVFDQYYKVTKPGFERVHNELEHYFSEEKNVTILNINKAFNGLDYTHVIPEKDKDANQHLNYKGIIKTSNYLANFLIDQYDLKATHPLPTNSPEALMYRNVTIQDDPSFKGKLTHFNKKWIGPDTVLTIPKKQSKFVLQGWSNKRGVNDRAAKRSLIFKKDTNFVYVSHFRNVRIDSTPATQDTTSYIKTGFQFELDTNLLEPGSYSIYLSTQAKDGTYYYKDLVKQLVVQ